MEKIEGLSIELDLDSVRLDRGLKGVKDNLKTVNSEMKANMSAFDRGDRSIKKYETRLQGLNKKLEVQKKATSEAYREYEKMVDEHGEGSKEAEKAAREYNKQSAALNNLERYVEGATEELEAMRKEQAFQQSSWGKMTKSLEDFSGRMNRWGDGFTRTGRALTKNVTAPMMAFGGVAIAAADKVQKAYRDIRVGTGATGDDLQNLEKSFDTVFANVPDDADQVSGALANLNTYTGATDDVLEGLTKTVLDVSRLLGEDATANSEAFGKAMQQWKKPADEGSDALDYLYKITQDYGVGLNEITGHLSTYGAVLNNAGFEMEEAAEFMGSLEANGISVSRVMPGLNSAFRKWADEGKNSREEFEKVISTIAETEDKQKALTIATETFGAEGAQRLMTAIRNDAIPSFEDLGKGAEDAKGSIQETTEETKTIGEQFAELRNEAMLQLVPLGEILIDLGEEYLPPLIDGVRNLAEWFDNLSPKAKDNALMIAGITAAAGPASIALGGIFKVTGSVAGGLANVTRAIGKGDKGLVGGLVGGLSKGGAVGLAIAGIGALSYVAYELWSSFKEGQEVNLDLAQSFSDQASDLESSADTFERLSDKASASNSELAELNDLNKRISESSNPGEIDQLQQRYADLAENSGLSKDELKELFEANDEIIDQAPDVQTAVSETGNKFVENTDAVREYVQSLRDMSEIELEAERAKLLDQEVEAREKINEAAERLSENNDNLVRLTELQNMGKDELNGKIEEINAKIEEGNISSQKEIELEGRKQLLTMARDNKLGDVIGKLQEEREEIKNSIADEEEKIARLEEVNSQMANIYLQNVGINAEGDEGLAKLDETITKNQEELAQLEDKRSKGEELTDEERERITALQETNAKHDEARIKIFEELGLYNNINGVLDSKFSKLSEEEQQLIRNLGKTAEINVEEGNIVSQIQDKNGELVKTREELIKNLEEEGATTQEINNQVGELDTKIQRNDTVLQDILTEAGLWGDVKDQINTGTSAIEGQGYGIDRNNDKTREGIGLEADRTAEAGRSVIKGVTVNDYGSVRRLDEKASAGKNKAIAASDYGSIASIDRRAGRTITKRVRLRPEATSATIGISASAFYADGTPPKGHPQDGPAVVGDGGGRELISTPRGKTFLSPGRPTLVNLAKGTHVFPHKETESILKGARFYADGTDGWERLTKPSRARSSEFMTLLALTNRNNRRDDPARINSNQSDNDYGRELLQATLEQNKILLQLLDKDTNAYFDTDSSAKALEPAVSKIQARKQNRQRRRPT